MAVRPIASIGWRTVVSGGSIEVMSAESSKPTTLTSRGTSRPARRTARIAPKGHRVARADDAGHPSRNQARCRSLGGLERVQRMRDFPLVELDLQRGSATARAAASLRREGM